MVHSIERSRKCGHQVDEPIELCLRCGQTPDERPQLRASAGRLRYGSVERPSSSSSLASRADDYRRSRNLSHLRGYRGSGAAASFTHAFTSGPDVEDDDDDDGRQPSRAIDMFPASVYRRSSRTPSLTPSSRSGSVYSSSSGLTPTERSPLTLPNQPSDAMPRPVAPTTATRDSTICSPADRAYSPMAAGFARLSNRSAQPASTGGERRTSRDAGLATIDARMFTGPA